MKSSGQTYGYDGAMGNQAVKQSVANVMADRESVLVYTNVTEAPESVYRPLGSFLMAAQGLGADESPLPGSPAWMNNSIRDASYEEIFHLMHFQGIGRQSTTLADLHNALFRPAAVAAWGGSSGAGIWHPDQGTYDEWLNEQNSDQGDASGIPGGSLYQEYIISVLDVYYGLWGHASVGFDGEYDPSTRADVIAQDAAGVQAIRAYLPDMLTYEEKLDPAFNGTFQLFFDAGKPYTHKSQYFTHVTLTGSNASHLIGNDADNTLTGNTSDNQLTGGKGNDQLDGAAGMDVAIFIGTRNQYSITRANGVIRVQDNVPGRDGIDTLRNVETLRFSDGDTSGELLQGWLQEQFPVDYGNSASEVTVWGHQADPDRDGRSNLQEYAEGTNPNQHDRGKPLVSSSSDSVITLGYRVSKARPDIGYTIQYSDTLAASSWMDATTYTMDVSGELTRMDHGVLAQVSAPVENGGDWMVNEGFTPSVTQVRRFFRAKMTYRP